MEQHTPVLLREVCIQFEGVVNAKKSIVAVDCTLGQGGHSYELFKRLKYGVLISIDLHSDSIEWVRSHYGLNPSHAYPGVYEKIQEHKCWYVLEQDFAEIEQVIKLFKLARVDFILADLGFSNYELSSDLGISFERPDQPLDMRYTNNATLQAKDVLNTFSHEALREVLQLHGDMQDSGKLARKIVAYRSHRLFQKVGDLLALFNRSSFPESTRIKLFQALRSYINEEPDKLNALVTKVPQLVHPSGEANIITFNSLEASLVRSSLYPLSSREVNIAEMIRNPQSRSATLYIYKKESNARGSEAE
ncbi:MAG: 16S rRNA (cytosine(1402)-N(4))-methyltransferase [Candidatus Dojkabacteria bacterium]